MRNLARQIPEPCLGRVGVGLACALDKRIGVLGAGWGRVRAAARSEHAGLQVSPETALAASVDSECRRVPG